MKFVLPGGSGHIGRILSYHFKAKGHEIVVLCRNPPQSPISGLKYVNWNAETLDRWVSEINNSDVVINLAGHSVNCRYNTKNKQKIMKSRVNSTMIIGKAIQNVNNPPQVWLQASGASVYAHGYEISHDEYNGILGGNETNIPKKWSFNVEVVKAWENAMDEFHMDKTRKIKLRTSLIMSPHHYGVFNTFLNLVRYRLGGKVGDGKQFISWIHFEDFLHVIEWILSNPEFSGILNITSPNPISHESFMQQLRNAWGVKIGIPTSKFMLEIAAIFMRTETELILKSRKVVPGILMENKFDFKFPHWKEASLNLVNSWKELRN